MDVFHTSDWTYVVLKLGKLRIGNYVGTFRFMTWTVR